MGQTACLKVLSISGGMATKLTVGGNAVLLDTVTGQGKTNGVPVGTLVVTAVQQKLTTV
jgi:hypothetical protein